jgi:hydroxyethylthiazole kinase-like uncharacterized protein yjeF
MLPSDQILTVAQMREAEEALFAGGETVDRLMKLAGEGAANWVFRLSGHRSVTVLCGPGNNGGDGYVIAESLRQRGVPVAVVAPFAPKTDAASNACQAYQGQVLSSGKDRVGSVLVDCLFGSGLTRALDEQLFGELRGLANRHGQRIAVDLPSGIESDEGVALNDGLPGYDLTIGLGAWKYAHWTMPSCARMGIRKLVPIGIRQRNGEARLLGKPLLRAPSANAHKYSRGLLGVIGGAMPGAGLLAAKAAMHGGAGYVKLFAEKSPVDLPPDLVVESMPVQEAIKEKRLAAILIGPGLGRDYIAEKGLRVVLARNLPIVVDADALVIEPTLLLERQAPMILTPHEGELAHLCYELWVAGQTKLELARGLAEKTGAVVVAKGPDTIIAAPGKETVLCPRPSSWLSTAGTGDILAGLIASRLAAGAKPLDAACQGVWLHGEAARHAGPAFSAGELPQHIPAALSECL